MRRQVLPGEKRILFEAELIPFLHYLALMPDRDGVLMDLLSLNFH